MGCLTKRVAAKGMALRVAASPGNRSRRHRFGQTRQAEGEGLTARAPANVHPQIQLAAGFPGADGKGRRPKDARRWESAGFRKGSRPVCNAGRLRHTSGRRGDAEKAVLCPHRCRRWELFALRPSGRTGEPPGPGAFRCLRSTRVGPQRAAERKEEGRAPPQSKNGNPSPLPARAAAGSLGASDPPQAVTSAEVVGSPRSTAVGPLRESPKKFPENPESLDGQRLLVRGAPKSSRSGHQMWCLNGVSLHQIGVPRWKLVAWVLKEFTRGRTKAIEVY